MTKLNKKVRNDLVSVGANATCYSCYVVCWPGATSQTTQLKWQKNINVSFSNPK